MCIRNVKKVGFTSRQTSVLFSQFVGFLLLFNVTSQTQSLNSNPYQILLVLHILSRYKAKDTSNYVMGIKRLLRVTTFLPSVASIYDFLSFSFFSSFSLLKKTDFKLQYRVLETYALSGH